MQYLIDLILGFEGTTLHPLSLCAIIYVMYVPNLHPVKIDSPQGVTQPQLKAMYRGERGAVTVFRSDLDPYYNLVAARTAPGPGGKTLIKVGSPFARRDPDEGFRYDSRMPREVIFRPQSASLDVLVVKPSANIKASTLHLCAAIALQLSLRGGYADFVAAGVELTALDDPTRHQATLDAALSSPLASAELQLNSSSLSELIRALLPDESLVASDVTNRTTRMVRVQRDNSRTFISVESNGESDGVFGGIDIGLSDPTEKREAGGAKLISVIPELALAGVAIAGMISASLAE